MPGQTKEVRYRRLCILDCVPNADKLNGSGREMRMRRCEEWTGVFPSRLFCLLVSISQPLPKHLHALSLFLLGGGGTGGGGGDE